MIEPTLTLDQTASAAPAGPRATIRLRNTGGAPETVNKRFALNYGDAGQPPGLLQAAAGSKA